MSNNSGSGKKGGSPSSSSNDNANVFPPSTSGTSRKMNSSVVYRSIIATNQGSTPPVSLADAAETTTLPSMFQDSVHVSVDAAKNKSASSSLSTTNSITTNTKEESATVTDKNAPSITILPAPWILEPVDGLVRCHLPTDKDVRIAAQALSVILDKESVGYDFAPSTATWRCSGAGMGSFNLHLYSLAEREASDLYALSIDAKNASKDNVTSFINRVKENNAISPMVSSNNIPSSGYLPKGRSLFLGTTPRLLTQSPNQAAALKSLIESFANHPFADIKYDLQKLVELSSTPVTTGSSR